MALVYIIKRNSVLFLILLQSLCVQGQSHWSASLQLGTVYNVPMKLNISQEGYPDLNMTAHYYTEPLTLPVYWDLRVARWQKKGAWEFEVIHHKLYLENTGDEVQHFGISHGFNMLMINRVWRPGWFESRVGGGFVLAHPENTIRGKTFGQTSDDLDMGYFISGPVINLALGKPVYVTQTVYLNFEVKSTLAWSQVKVADGHARLWNWALHAVCGLGFDFAKKDER